MKRHALATLFLVAVAGCQPAPNAGPPAVEYGRSECAQCGMIVSSDRFSAGIAGATVDGEHRDLHFDDINCMVKYGRAHPATVEQARLYVHDVDTRAWLDARTASFTRDPSMHTPMGSGLVARAAPTDASAALTWPALLNDSSPSTRK